MIGIIGAGNMGGAMAKQFGGRVIISDKDYKRLRFLKAKMGRKTIRATMDNARLVRDVDTIIIAVKPQDIADLLKEIRPYLTEDKLIISIAAGVRLKTLEDALGRMRLIRVMPNLPVLTGKGMSAIARGRFATKKDMQTARNIFSRIGQVVELDEKYMDAVTALSGSGPAYYFLFTNLLEKAGETVGLKRNIARQIIKATFLGSASLAEKMDIPMEDFVKRVASKGGTTEAALKVFKKSGFEKIIKKAVDAAYNRSKELAAGS